MTGDPVVTGTAVVAGDPARPTVVVSSRSFSSGHRDLTAELAAAGLQAVRVSTDHAPDDLLPALRTATAWIAGTAPVTAEHLAAAPQLRVIARYGVGVESVDLAAADRAGVIVTNTPGANSAAVSEHTVALVLAALRRIVDGDVRLRRGDWSVSRGRQLAGSTAGVVGFGRIGRGTAARLAALGCRVLVHDPFVADDTVRAAGAEPVELADLRRQADVVTLHAPGGARLVDETWLADCRPAQLVVNTARADLVDEAALAAALRDGRLFAYAADTLRSESRSDHGSPLLDPELQDRVTITPHLGAQTTEAVDLMGGMAVADVIAVHTGQAPAHRVGARHRMRFVGADTGSSSILTLFPVWSQMLGLDAELLSLDIPIGAPAEQFRDAVTAMRDDEKCVGALVTTHKISVYEAARDLFDEVDPFGTECGEISSISYRDGRTLGAAKDPITAGLSLQEFLSDDHFAAGGEVLCLGAGGAGTAIGWYLAQRDDAPGRLIVVDTAPDRLQHLEHVVAPHASRTALETGTPDTIDVPARLAGLPAGSLVVNATGLGKERPGSPLPDSAVFPADAVVWDLNYRGSLEFLAQARSQQADRRLTVVDGWRYFIHGWTQVIAEVFGVPMPPQRVAELAAAAEELRR